MKILYYVHALVIGGAETIVANNLIELKSNQVDVVLVVNQRVDTFLEKRVLDAGIKIYALDTTMPKTKCKAILWKIKIRFINYKRRLNRIIAEEKPNIIHVHSLIYRLDGVNFPANKIVYTFHADVERALRIYSKRNFNVLKKMSSNGLSFFALTEKAKDDIKKHFNTDRIFITPNSVDINSIKSNAYSGDKFLSELNIPDSAFVVGHIGRFHKVKNHERIIDIFNAVHKKRRDSFLVLIGGDEDGRMSVIRERIHNYGLDDYVRFLGVRDDATAIISCFDVFILPSFSESFSLATIEAQALGIKCVVSDAVPNDVICNSNCVRISLNKSDENWADNILTAYKNNYDGDIFKFDKKNVIGQLIGLYEKIAG